MATAEKTNIQPFGVEINAARNRNVMLQSIPGVVLRGRLVASRPVIDLKTGEERIPTDQVRHLGTLPTVPGMEIHVNIAKLTYTIRDPLYENEALCETLRKRLREQNTFRGDGKIHGHPPQSGTLDTHRMKTLCRELLQLVANNDATPVGNTPLPKQLDVDELPGNYLLNPGMRTFTSQPTFEKDWDNWVEQLTRAGG